MDSKEKLIFLLKQPTFVIIVGYFYIISTIQFGFNPYDSGVVLTGGMRILHGDLPYRDFFTMYAPGQFYLDAFLQLISREVIFIRFILSFLQLGILVLVARISILLFGNKYYIYSVLMSALWLGGLEIYNRGITTSVLLVLLTLWYILKCEDKNKKLNYTLLGFLVSITIFFRHDVGLLALFLLNLYFLYVNYKDRNVANYFKSMFFQSIGLIPLIIFITYLIFNVSWSAVYNDLIIIPKEVFPKYRSIPFPQPFEYLGTESFGILRFIKSTLHSLTFYIPFFTILLYIIKFIKFKVIENKELLLLIGILIFTNQMLVRSELEHSTPAAILASISYFYLLKKLINHKMILVVAFFVFLPNIVGKKVSIIKNIFPNIVKSQLTGINNLYLNHEYYLNLEKSVKYIKSNTSEKEKIYVGETGHDNTFINEAAFYYFAKRLPATKYHELHPGITTISKTQKVIINEIEKSKVRYIILRDNKVVENQILDDGKNLDAYIKYNFKIVEIFGDFQIYKRITSQ